MEIDGVIFNGSFFRHCLVLLFFACVLIPSVEAETLRLKSGRTIDVEVLEKTDDHIKVKFKDVQLTFYDDEIESISSELSNEDLRDTSSPAKSESIKTEDIGQEMMEAASQSVVVVMTEGVGEPSVLGTGFFVSDDGVFATNLHVVFKADYIFIRTRDGKRYPVKDFVYYDDQIDFCLLQADIEDSPALPVGDSDELYAGQNIFIVGHPLDQEYSEIRGQYLQRKFFGETEMLMTSLNTDIGISGAPIMDQGGRVVGIAVLSSLGSERYTFAIPVNDVKEFFGSTSRVPVASVKKTISKAFELVFSGQGLFLQEKHQEAMNDFQQALDMDRENLQAYIGLGRVYQALNRTQDAFSAWQEVQKMDPENREACSFLGKNYLDRNMLDEAIEYLEKAVALGSHSVHLYNDLGYAYSQKGLMDQAVDMYQKTVEMCPSYANGYYNLAVVYHRKGDRKAAKNYCGQALQLGHDVPEDFLHLLGLK